MGNSKGKPAVAINTTKPYYYPGDLVEGAVYLNCPKPFACSKIVLQISGSEKTWWRKSKKHPVYHVDACKKPQYDKYLTDYEGQSKILDCTYELNNFNSSQNVQGQYTFPFTFYLPTYIPASFKEQNSDFKASISYELNCVAVSSSDFLPSLTHSLQILVQQNPAPKNQVPNGTLTFMPTSCCCCSNKGFSQLNCQLTKNRFQPNETCTLKCEINNLNCKSKVKGLKVKLVKVVTLFSSTGYEVFFVEELSHASSPGGDAFKLYQKQQARSISLPLRMKSKDVFTTSSTHGRLIRCKYLLEIHPEVSGCCSKASNYLSLELKIGQAQVTSVAIEAPEDWNPEVFRNSNIILDQRFANEKFERMTDSYPSLY